MVSVDEYNKLQSPESPFLTNSKEIFDTKLIPTIESIAVNASDLIETLKTQSQTKNFNDLCKEFGYRESPDLQCNFAVKVSGTITNIKTKSRRGTITIKDSLSGVEYKVQVGPVISGTALRDIQRDVAYKDFNDQTVYGEYGKRMNSYSAEISAKEKFALGDQYEVIGAFSSWDVPTSVQIAPVKYIKK